MEARPIATAMSRPSPTLEAIPEGDWLFEKEGRIYGPVPGAKLVELLDRGEVDARTPVAAGEGGYRPLGEVPGFAVHARKAEARQRVEREITGARLLARRRRRRRVVVLAALSLSAAGGAGWVAFRLARERPWETRSALLEDFGGGVAIAMPARVGGGRRPEADDVELPPEEPAAPRGEGAPPTRPPARPREGLVQSSWDGAQIQAVVAREQRTLVPCIRAESDRARGWSGEVPIEFAIGNDGRVAQMWIDGERKSSAELRACLLAALERWSFKPFPGERPVVSLSFRVGAR